MPGSTRPHDSRKPCLAVCSAFRLILSIVDTLWLKMKYEIYIIWIGILDKGIKWSDIKISYQFFFIETNMNCSRSSEMMSCFICAPETIFVDLTFRVIFPNCMLTLIAYLLFVMIMVSYKLKNSNVAIITQMHLLLIWCFVAASAPLLLSFKMFMITNFTKSCYRLSNI